MNDELHARRPEEEPPGDPDYLRMFDPDRETARRLLDEIQRDLRRHFEHNRHREPEDAVQEVFARGLKRLRDGVTLGTGGVRAYFFGIANNVIREGWKPKQRREQQPDEVFWDLQPSPRDERNAAEAMVALSEALDQLDPPDADLLVRYYTEDAEQLARKLQMSANTLRVKVCRIRKRLPDLE